MSVNHLFAFYCPSFEDAKSSITISDESLVHRMSRVLRMKKGDQCILFNARYNVHVELVSIDRRSITCFLLSKQINTKPTISLQMVIPILKREALSKAVYGATEMGVSEIQLVVTTKSRQSLLPHEFTKLQSSIVAASEQAKHFIMATLQSPKLLPEYLTGNNRPWSLLADPAGSPVFEVLSNLKGYEKLSLFVGPEGDFTKEEKDLLSAHGVQAVRLTPTVLQSYQAVTLLAGICSSYFD